MMQAIVTSPALNLPTLIVSADHGVQLRFLCFFAANVRNPNIRRAYAQGIGEFLGWCSHHGVASLASVQPLHIAGYIEELGRVRSAPMVKLHLAALRHLFDWLVIGQVVATNPAGSVRGPSHSVKRGKTSVLAPEEARRLLDNIDGTTPSGVCDRALIAPIVFSFARIGAALKMRVEDAYTQNRRLWVRLHEKGDKQHEMRCHYSLVSCLRSF